MSSDPPPARPPPVRLVTPTARKVFAPGRETTLAKIRGDGLRALDIRDGDHVVLVRRDRAEHGDLAAVLDADGRACLWKVYPEGECLRLSMGYPSTEISADPSAQIHGVVVGVIRRMRSGSSTGRGAG